jgi:DNA-binding GntR family transcriptional regulator
LQQHNFFYYTQVVGFYQRVFHERLIASQKIEAPNAQAQHKEYLHIENSHPGLPLNGNNTGR